MNDTACQANDFKPLRRTALDSRLGILSIVLDAIKGEKSQCLVDVYRKSLIFERFLAPLSTLVGIRPLRAQASARSSVNVRHRLSGVARVAERFNGIPQARKDQEELFHSSDLEQVQHPVVHAGQGNTPSRLLA